MEHVLIGNGNEITLRSETAELMEQDDLIYCCDEDHPDDAIYYHATDMLEDVCYRGR